MPDPQIIEGTWEEVARQAAKLAGSGRRVKLIIASDSSEAPAPQENASAIALLDEWLAEDRAVSTADREEADREWEEFRASVDAYPVRLRIPRVD